MVRVRARHRVLLSLTAAAPPRYPCRVKPLRWWVPLSSAAVALLFGILPYALLSAAGELPPALRDDPWPLELVAVLAALVTLGLCVAAFRQRRARVVATVATVLATASTALFLALVHVLSYELPPPPAEIAVGTAAPDFTLPDEAGRPVTLTAMHGHPTLLVFYRGFW